MADNFIADVADRLFRLPGVQAVALGGSRAQGTHRPDSDWDLGLYYRGTFDPDDLRAVGWAGEVFDVGAWGGGIFNGGAWLQVDGQSVDVIYRDLDVVEHEMGEAQAGRFHVEPLLFHLAGIPSYLVVAELAINRVLRGELPVPLQKPAYPDALRKHAPGVWWADAELLFGHARNACAPQGRVAQSAGLLIQAAMKSAHSVLAARGEWITNEKTLLARAGLGATDDVVAGLDAEPAALRAAVERAHGLCEAALRG